MAEEKEAPKRQPRKSNADKVAEKLDEVLKLLADIPGDVWPVVVERVEAIKQQVEKHK